MNFKKKTLAAALMLVMTCGFAHAQTETTKPGITETDASEITIKEAQDQLAASFSELKVTSFKPSPIAGIFEIQTGVNTIYFRPNHGDQKGVLIIGQMFDENGINLTEKSKFAGMADVLKNLPLDSAVTIGPKTAPVVYEFTDPDCPYCHAYDDWMKTYSKDHPVQRKLFFFNAANHPLAEAKMKHVICSEDKDAAYRYVYSGELPHNPDDADALKMAKQNALKTCKEADEVLSKHMQVVQALGVSGTPSFLFNVDTKPELIVGFNQSKIAEAIMKLEKDAEPKVSKSTDKTAK